MPEVDFPSRRTLAPMEAAGRPLARRESVGLEGRTRRWLVFFHESMKPTADKLQDLMGLNIQLSEFKWDHFPDGFPNLQINSKDAQNLEHFYGTCFLCSFHTPAVIFEQLSLLYALPRLRARNFRIILPWFPTGTMERVETIGQIATAASLARMLSAIPAGPGGPATLVIYDIHALQEQFYFADNILVELKSAIWLLKQKLDEMKKENPGEEIAIAFPDDGAHKRFYSKFEGYEMVICNKIRQGDQRIVKVKEGDPSGKHCVIVDDLVQSGGTLLQCAKPMKEMGAIKVSCFCTHGVFPNKSYQKFIGNADIHKFWVTDSVPSTVAELEGKAPFEVLSLAPLLEKYLMGVAEDV